MTPVRTARRRATTGLNVKATTGTPGRWRDSISAVRPLRVKHQIASATPAAAIFEAALVIDDDPSAT
jgi:hypothetical protein